MKDTIKTLFILAILLMGTTVAILGMAKLVLPDDSSNSHPSVTPQITHIGLSHPLEEKTFSIDDYPGYELRHTCFEDDSCGWYFAPIGSDKYGR